MGAGVNKCSVKFAILVRNTVVDGFEPPHHFYKLMIKNTGKFIKLLSEI